MKLTKLEKLLMDDDKGVSSGTGALSKILRSFWKDIGLSHQHLAALIDAWLEDPNNEFEQDQTKINNSRGNIRKDNEKDKLTWKIFTRNLRILRPLEVRFLVRLKFKNGATFRQVAVMRPHSSSKYNSDFIFDQKEEDEDVEDGFELKDAADYDDEGFHKSEKEYTAPNGLKINQIEWEDPNADDEKADK